MTSRLDTASAGAETLRRLVTRFRGWLASPEARRTGTVPGWVSVAALVALTCVSYWNSLWGEFVYDDLHTVRENLGIRGFAAFWGYISQQFHRPLLMLSFAANYELGGLDPFGYHLTNLALHVIDVLLVLAFARAAFARTLPAETADLGHARAAWLAAAIFALHPVQTEAVSYVASRSSVLSTTFILAAVLTYLRELDARGALRAFWRGLGVAWFLAAMATKEIALATPFLLVLVDRTLAREPGKVRSWRESLRGVTPHLGLLAAGAAIRIMIQHAVRTPDITWSVLDHWRTELGVWLRYPQLVIFPVNLNVDPAIPLARAWSWREQVGAAALVVAIAGAVLASRRRPLVTLGAGWFLLALAPTSLIPLQDFIAERRLYLAMAGPTLLAGWALARLGTDARWSRAASVATLALLTWLAIGTVARNRAWATPLALWTDTVRKSPDKARPHGNLATALAQRGQLDAALAHYERALALNPELVEYRIDRASLYRIQGRYDEALAELDRVIAERSPDDRLTAAAWHQVGEVRLAQRDYDGALEVFQTNAARKIVHPETFLRIGRIYYLRGDLAKAETAFLESVHRWFWDSAGHRALAFVYYRTGREKDAIRELEDAIAVEPQDREAAAALAEIRAGRPLRVE